MTKETRAKIRTLIVDDEPLALEKLALLLADEADVEIIGECGDGVAAVEAIEKLAPDLVFLDVQMPELDGFEVLAALDVERMPAIIFVTAYDRYALQAFDVRAIDYLLKPFDRARLRRALGRARREIERERAGELNVELKNLLADLKAKPKKLERLVIKSGGRVFFLRVEEIDWIESAANYVQLHVGRETHLLRETINTLAARLDPDKFLRIHRSTIVNLERIREMQPWFHGCYVVILSDGTELRSSRSFRDSINRLMVEST
jgi:two-component system LytT family response regulator